MEWDEVDLEKKIWTIPSTSDEKKKRKSKELSWQIPLSPEALRIIKAQPKRKNTSILAIDKKENLMLLNRMTDRLFLSSTTFHSALISLLLVVTTMSANTVFNQPLQSFMPVPVLMKGSAMCPVLIHWIVSIWKAAWL